MPGTIALPDEDWDEAFDGHATWCLRGFVAGMHNVTRAVGKIPSFSQRYDCPACGIWKIKQRLLPYVGKEYSLLQLQAGSRKYRSQMKAQDKGGISLTFDDNVKFLMTDLETEDSPLYGVREIYRFLVRYQLRTATCRRIAFIAPWTKETKMTDTVWRPMRHKRVRDMKRYDQVISVLMAEWGGAAPLWMAPDDVFDEIETRYDRMFKDDPIDLMNPDL